MTFFLVLIAIQAALLLYAAPDPAANTDIWTFVTNIDNWNSLAFILAVIGIAGGISLLGVAAGSVFAFRTDFLMFAPAMAGFISMGVVFVNLGNTIRNELISRFFPACTGYLATCTPVNFILAITIGPMAFYYVWTVIEWWRGKDY